MEWEFGLLVVVYLTILFLLIHTAITGISPVPTTRAVRGDMLAQVPDDVQGKVLELGSGWGALAFALARRLPRCEIVGFELSPIPWAYSRVRLALFPQPNLRIVRGNFHRASYQDVGLVVCYLFPGGMRALRPKFEAELPSGAVVISNTFAIPEWRPIRTIQPQSDPQGPQVYVYRLPESLLG